MAWLEVLNQSNKIQIQPALAGHFLKLDFYQKLCPCYDYFSIFFSEWVLRKLHNLPLDGFAPAFFLGAASSSSLLLLSLSSFFLGAAKEK